MPGLELYDTHELMNFTSNLMREEFTLHELEGGEYDDDVTKLMAKRVIFSCVPQILNYLNARILVESPSAQVLENDNPTPVEGLHVEAKFISVVFQPVLKQTRVEGYSGSLLLEDHDLFATVRPQFEDPEPGSIIFGDEVMIPFGDVTKFEPITK